jgi:hypothetical protein
VRELVTLHGIDADGEWQRRVSAVLKPHFSVHPIRIGLFRYLGAPSLVLEPWIPVAAVGFAVLASAPLGASMLILGGSFPLGYGLRGIRRWLALKSFKNQFDKAGLHSTPHLIAHSLGTRIAADALVFQDVDYERIVLVGSLLPSNFDWDELLKSGRATAVWNEVAPRDWVVRIGNLLRTAIRGAGPSGFEGFRGPSVHDRPSPTRPCPSCGPGSEAPIHNVVFSEYGHSHSFIGAKHIARFWLPFLWNLEPLNYRKFLRLCARATRFESQGAETARNSTLALLGSLRWDWIDSTLDDYLAKEIDMRGVPSNVALVLSAKRQMCLSVCAAMEESKRHDPDSRTMEWLHPLFASGQSASAIARSSGAGIA